MPRPQDFTFDARSGRYRDARGRFVPRAAVRQALDAATQAAGTRMVRLTEQLRERTISLADWQGAMRAAIKESHLYATAAARGGWQHMAPADILRAGREIRRQYGFLQDLARDLAAGKPVDGNVMNSARLYGRAARTTYHLAERDGMAVRGFDEERSILHPADHCSGCVEEAAKDWQPLGAMVPIGLRPCRQNDRCSTQYRNSRTGQVMA